MLQSVMLLDALERFFNAQSDTDWAWWPLLRLRPPRNVNFRVRFLVRVFLGEFVFFAALLFVSILALTGADVIATAGYFSTPAGIALLLGDLVFSLVTSSPYFLFWNRRAERLRRTPPPRPEVIVRPDVWPPPPRIPSETQE